MYSTPDMIRLMETACFHALQPFCDEGEITVGISIHVEHRAASGIGMRIHARAELESFDGRFYIMRVTADDGTQEIGARDGRTRGRARTQFSGAVETIRGASAKGQASDPPFQRPRATHSVRKVAYHHGNRRPKKPFNSGSFIVGRARLCCRMRGMSRAPASLKTLAFRRSRPPRRASRFRWDIRTAQRISREEMIARIGRIARAVKVPVTAD